MTEGLTNIDRVRLALAMADAGYPWEIEIEYVEELLSAFDALSNAAQIQGCLHPGKFGCQYYGKCLSVSCDHYGKTWYGPRMTLEAQDPNILYPKVESS